MLAAQTQGRGNAAQDRPPFEIFRVEGQPIDRRPPELDTDHPVFPGQTHAPYRKTVDISVSTIASNLDVPWAVAMLPSGRFLITEKSGRFRILNRDGSSFRTITENLPSIHVEGQAGLLDVALDRNYRTNHRIFFTSWRECLDRTLFWTAADLETKLLDFQRYYNGHRTHAGLDGRTPESSTDPGGVRASVRSYRWQPHCRGLYQTPMAA